MQYTAHIIPHTHWDREWYLNSSYTNEWLLPFFDNLFAMLDSEPEYRFVLDGQMLKITSANSKKPGDRFPGQNGGSAFMSSAGRSFSALIFSSRTGSCSARSHWCGICLSGENWPTSWAGP